jgi:hypothetical protein
MIKNLHPTHKSQKTVRYSAASTKRSQHEVQCSKPSLLHNSELAGLDRVFLNVSTFLL